jgi:predicted dithiol-disulfide oxidoreductase (DUF899 family)
MFKVKVAHIAEGPSDNLRHSRERIDWEMQVYSMIRAFELEGFNIMRQSDKQLWQGWIYYAVFATEEEAALFKLTRL